MSRDSLSDNSDIVTQRTLIEAKFQAERLLTDPEDAYDDRPQTSHDTNASRAFIRPSSVMDALRKGR